MGLIDGYLMWRRRRAEARAERAAPVRQPIRMSAYHRAQAHFAGERQKALGAESDENLAHYMGEIRHMEDSADYDGSIHAREAREIQNEVIARYDRRRNPDSEFFLLQAPEVPPAGWPRLHRVTLQALGNAALLALRDEEDRARDGWVRRAAEALRGLEASGVGLTEVLDGQAGKRWIAEHCFADPELAADAVLSVHPGMDVVGGTYRGESFVNPIWKPPPPKTPLRPI